MCNEIQFLSHGLIYEVHVIILVHHFCSLFHGKINMELMIGKISCKALHQDLLDYIPTLNPLELLVSSSVLL